MGRTVVLCVRRKPITARIFTTGPMKREIGLNVTYYVIKKSERAKSSQRLSLTFFSTLL